MSDRLDNDTVKNLDMELARMKLRARIEQIKNLPTLPEVATKLLDLLWDETCSASQLAKEIANDQSLTAKILKVVNSAYYGFHRQITTLQEAVVILGLEEMQRLIATISVFGMMKPSTIGTFSRKSFWEHSATTAIASELVAEKIGRPVKGIFVCGLLHDIGKVALDQFFHSDWETIVQKAQQEGTWVGETEQSRFGTTHAEVGAWLTERWSLPPLIVEAIRQHHRLQKPGKPSESDLWAIIQLGDLLTRRGKFGSGGDESEPPVFEGLKQHFGLSDEAFEQLEERLKQRVDQLGDSWDVLRS